MPEWTQRPLSVVSQDAPFDETLRENLLLGCATSPTTGWPPR
ncbi:MAG: hypothetical protein R3D85_03870 [Paracoccaceae bacterium]